MVGGGRGGLMDGGDHCCISKFMLKSTKSLKDLSKDSNVFLISRLVSMCSAKNLLAIVSSRLAC